MINEKKFYCNTGISYVYIQNNLTDEKTGNLAESPEEIKDTTHVIVDTLDSNLPSSQYLNGIVPKVIGDHFIDIQFPPEARIINALDGNGRKVPGKYTGDCSSNDHINTSGIQFQRAKDLFKGKFSLYHDKIEPNDLRQGQLGNCWLVSALASLATRNDIVQKLFRNNNIAANGLYEIYGYDLDTNKKICVPVDDYFAINYGGTTKFLQPQGNELWAILLEKAFSKYEGGYANLDGGLCDWAFKFFTGAVCKYFHKNQFGQRNIWEEVACGIKKRHIICAGSNNGRDSNSSNLGIFQGHAYSIIDAKEYTNNSTSIKLLKMRNPWGQKEWKGNW